MPFPRSHGHGTLALVKSSAISRELLSVTGPLRVGIAGLGTVGASVIRILARQNEAVAAAWRAAGRGHGGFAPATSPRTGASISPAARGSTTRSSLPARRTWIASSSWSAAPTALRWRRSQTALNARQDVVTANKALLAKHGLALATARRSQGRVARLRGVRRRRHPDHQDPA